MPSAVASISLFLYTTDASNNKLEAYLFTDAVNPYIQSPTSMTPTIVVGSTTV
jgi:hypothetical protein